MNTELELVEVFDTTLRDGLQVEGVSATVDDKLRIAEQLDFLGVHYIEGGWPGANPKDIEFFKQARRKKFRHARLAAFGSTRRKGVAVEDDDQVALIEPAQMTKITLRPFLSFSAFLRLFSPRDRSSHGSRGC